MCRQGNPSRSLKKNRGTLERARHLDLLDDTRCLARRDAEREDDVDSAVWTLPAPVFASRPRITLRNLPDTQASSAVVDDATKALSEDTGVMLPLKLFIKCQKGCVDCQPRKRRDRRSAN